MRAIEDRGAAITTLAVLFTALGATAALSVPPQELVVFEAASLKDAFVRLGERFEKQNSGVKVLANAAGSQELRTQIEHGAKADVFASADLKHIEKLRQAGLVSAPTVFTCNEPVLVVRPGSAVKTFRDLPLAERLVVGAPEVPIGGYTNQILAGAAKKYGPEFDKRVQAHIVSRELNVRQVLAKVTLGEADAGIVYKTDALAAKDKAVAIAIPAELNVTAEYPIAVVKGAPRSDLAKSWIAFVTSPSGQAVLAEYGFSACQKR